MNKKYYILKRNSPRLLAEYTMDIVSNNKTAIKKRTSPEHDFILIEKTQVADNTGTTEHYTNLWTFNEGNGGECEKITKGLTMWDYTGYVYPLIHKEGKIMTFKDYCETL